MAAKLIEMQRQLKEMRSNDDMWGALHEKLFLAEEAVGEAIKRAEDPMMG